MSHVLGHLRCLQRGEKNAVVDRRVVFPLGGHWELSAWEFEDTSQLAYPDTLLGSLHLHLYFGWIVV